MNQPLLEIVGGPNGSGKSTFAESYLVKLKGRENYLNPDLISAAVAPGSNGSGLFTAGRILLRQIEEHLSDRSDFAFESTLSGKTYVKICEQAEKSGYFIRIYFVFLGNKSLNLQRVKDRVKMGGHDVPRKDIIRRYRRSLENFWGLYRPLANDWILVDNTLRRPQFKISKAEFDRLDSKQKESFTKRFLKGKVSL